VSWAPPTPTTTPVRKLSARTRFVLAMEQADTARAELGAAVLDGRPVGECAQLLARLARLEADVAVADRRNSIVTRIASAAGRVIK
jgi:hypothetical protein